MKIFKVTDVTGDSVFITVNNERQVDFFIPKHFTTHKSVEVGTSNGKSMMGIM